MRRPTLLVRFAFIRSEVLGPGEQARSQRRLGIGDLHGDQEHNPAAAAVRYSQTRNNQSLALKEWLCVSRVRSWRTWIRDGR